MSLSIKRQYTELCGKSESGILNWHSVASQKTRYTKGKGVRCPERCKQETTSRRKARKERPAVPISPEPKREHPSTYFVADRSNQEELNRL